MNPNLIINSLLARIFTEYPQYPWTAIITETRIGEIDSFVRLQELIKFHVPRILVTLKTNTEYLVDESHILDLSIQTLEFTASPEYAPIPYNIEGETKEIKIEDFTFIIGF